MKSILLIMMLATMLFSSEKQIIVGSFLQENYALNDLVKLNNYILSDDKLSKLINKNSIEVELKKIGKYHAISLSPFNSYVQLLRTLKALETYYDDAYVLENEQEVKITQAVTKVEVQEIPPPAIVKTEKPKETKILKAKYDDSVGVQTDKQVKAVQIYEEVKKDYTLEIVLALLVLLGVGYIILKTRKRIKKDMEG
ncbi:MAG: hypothetical protein PF437_05350 [Sulfurimonas sp.]|jgi:hypothetical protein|nr:hypothetical protein [Sulfurimonas sp.]